MTRYYAENLGETSINEATGIASDTTEFDVSDASQLPLATPFKITVDDEIMNVTSVIGNTLTVVRGQESTVATPHGDATIVSNNPTAGAWNSLWDDIDLHVGSGGSSHAVATDSVNGFMSASDKDKLDDYPTTPAGISEIAGSISALSDTGSVTTDHLRQVNASESSKASGENSQVNASYGSTSSASRSQVNTSYECVAQGSYSSIISSGFTINNSAQSVAGGNAESGVASTANRTWHIYSITGNIEIAGSLSSSHTFTDYGEFFPNLVGIEIQIGTPVIVDGYGVRPVSSGEDIDGVVSGTAALRLGDTPFTWQGRYLRDEWGRIQTEDIEVVGDRSSGTSSMIITVPIENPDYDPTLENIPRSERPDEWTMVGLIGQVFVRVDKDVVVGDYLVGGAGIATTSPTKTNIKVMIITTTDPDEDYNIAYCFIK